MSFSAQYLIRLCFNQLVELVETQRIKAGSQEERDWLKFRIEQVLNEMLRLRGVSGPLCIVNVFWDQFDPERLDIKIDPATLCYLKRAGLWENERI